MMATAKWQGKIIAQSDETVMVEGNHYFPTDSLRQEFFRPSDYQTTCGWKGTANYKSIEVDGQVNKDAAWYYPNPKPKAESIRNHFAFWKGVEVTAEDQPDSTPDGAAC
ncbi:DUF427 domain-containing protein [Planctomycetaceae bacterium SH139]